MPFMLVRLFIAMTKYMTYFGTWFQRFQSSWPAGSRERMPAAAGFLSPFSILFLEGPQPIGWYHPYSEWVFLPS
jgi:hypothetical protein